MRSDRFVAVGLLSRRDLDVLGSGFRRAFPVNTATDFNSLLIKIDQAEKKREDGECRSLQAGALAPGIR